MNKFAIIVAGGSGARMNSDIPKQFLTVHGKPILMYTLEKFAQEDVQLLLVLNVDFHEYWKKLCITHSFNIPHTLVKGGRTRYQSVKNSLDFIKEKSLIAVHDAVRPCINSALIYKAFEEAAEFGNAVLAISPKDSIRKVENDKSYSVPRENYVLIQTPQVFQSEILKKAYKESYRNEFTDDASVVEFMGEKIHLMQGDTANIKITYPEDLKIAEALLINHSE